MLLYSMLHLVGLRPPARRAQALPPVGLARRRAIPSTCTTPGVETTTGPLGQGIANAVGIALGAKMIGARFRRGAVSTGARLRHLLRRRRDGRRQRPRPRSLAGHLGPRQPRLLLRRQPASRSTARPTSRSPRTSASATRRTAGSCSTSTATTTRRSARRSTRPSPRRTRPSFIVARTHIGNGAPNAHDTAKAHGEPLGKDEIAAHQEGDRLGPSSRTFLVPDEVRALFTERARGQREGRTRRGKPSSPRGARQRGEPRRSSTQFEARDVPANLYERAPQGRCRAEGRRDPQPLERDPAAASPSSCRRSSAARPTSHPSTQDATSRRAAAIGRRASSTGGTSTSASASTAWASICNGMALVRRASSRTARRSSSSATTCARRVRLSALGAPAVPLDLHARLASSSARTARRTSRSSSSGRSATIPNLARRPPGRRARDARRRGRIALSRKDAPDGDRAHAPEARRPSSATRGFDPKNDPPRRVRRAGGDRRRSRTSSSSRPAARSSSPSARASASRRRARRCASSARRASRSSRSRTRPTATPCSRRARVASRSRPASRSRGAVGSATDGLAIGIDHYGASAPDKVLAEKFGFTPDAVVAKIHAWLG